MMKTTLLAAMATTAQAAVGDCITATTGDKLACVAPLIATDKIDYKAETEGKNYGADYRGRQNKTKTGRVCQAWAAQTPVTHDRTPEAYPDQGLESNFCRNPRNTNNGIWCYVSDSKSDTNDRYEECDPLVKPDCTDTADCYEAEYKDGCCTQLTITAEYKATDDTKKFGYIKSVFDSTGKADPVAGNTFAACMNKKYVDEYAGALATGTAITGNADDNFAKVFKADGGVMFDQTYASVAAFYTAMQTDEATMKAMTLNLTCLKSEESAMKVAISAIATLITAATLI